jgi:hypothetical protein
MSLSLELFRTGPGVLGVKSEGSASVTKGEKLL